MPGDSTIYGGYAYSEAAKGYTRADENNNFFLIYAAYDDGEFNGWNARVNGVFAGKHSTFELADNRMKQVLATHPSYICGKHFCEHCGDCLYCYGSDPCSVSADEKHRFVPNERADEVLMAE